MARLNPLYPETARKLYAYSAQPVAGFQVVRVLDHLRAPWQYVIKPDGGREIEMSREEAEAWLSGWVTGRRAIQRAQGLVQ